MVKWFYIGFVTVALILLSGSYPKIALALAGLIFFGAVLMNVETFKKMLSPK